MKRPRSKKGRGLFRLCPAVRRGQQVGCHRPLSENANESRCGFYGTGVGAPLASRETPTT